MRIVRRERLNPVSLRERLLQTQGVLRGALFRDLLRERIDEAPLPPGTRVGAWRVVRELARGGMGTVYLAERDDGEFEQSVALKWLSDAVHSPESETLFRRERQFLARLSHPNITRLIDGGRSEQGHLWFAMEYVEGLPIDRHAHAAGLDERARVALLLPVLEAVAFAHSRLLIHRDIKPGNVLIDPQGQPKLLDFGIAGLAQERDQAGAFTPGYASPEQRALQAVGTPSDIWQLGRLLDAVLRAGAARPPAADLQAIVGLATRDDPGQRYATVVALKRDLVHYLEHRPVAARRGGALYRFARALRRHPLGAASAAALALALAALAAGFAFHSANERERLLQARDRATSINQFLAEDVLTAMDPFQRSGGEKSIADSLERSVRQAERRFGEHPDIAGRLLTSLGGALLSHGRTDAAGHAAERALALLTASDGADARSTAEAALLRATVDDHRGAPEPSRVRLDRLQAGFPYRDQPTSSLEWRIQEQRGWNAMLRASFAECIGIYTRIARARTPPGSSALGLAYNSLSLCQRRAGRPAQALATAKAAERLIDASDGPDSGNAAIARTRVAMAMNGMGHHREAARKLLPEVQTLIALLGDNHGATATHMDLLASIYLCGNDNANAGYWAERSVRGRTAAFGREHPWTIGAEAEYALILLRSGQTERARARFAEVERMQRGVEDVETLARIYRATGERYLREGQYDRALSIYRSAEALASRPGMEYRLQLHNFQAAIALTLTRAGRREEARRAYARYDASARHDSHCLDWIRQHAAAERGGGGVRAAKR